MERLEEAVEEIMRQSFIRKSGNRYGIKQKDDLLFFPRNKIRMIKIRSGNWEPKAWFIHNRTREKATGLELPTETSREGLTSGYRSGIVKDKNGKYLKLKGICLGTLIGEPKDRGLCDLTGAIAEQVNSIGLTYEGFPHLQIRPKYIEAHFFPLKVTVKEFMEGFRLPRKAVHTQKVEEYDTRGMKRELGRYGHFIEKGVEDVLNKGHYFVSALEIDADTRLDEAIYYLTKKELNGLLKAERDNLLQTLAFRAGYCKAALNLHNASWGKDLKNTNNHLGNFVLHSTENGILDIGLVDISDIQKVWHFNGNHHKHLQDELASLAQDFHAKGTYSLASQQRYRHFPEELRRQCEDAMRTGYGTMLMYTRMDCNDIRPIDTPERILVPKQFMITTEEFKYVRDKIMKYGSKMPEMQI